MAPVLKLRFQGQFHRLLLPEGEPTFETVIEAVRRTEADPRFTPKYRDDEGDLCTLISLSFSDFLAGSRTVAGQLVLKLELVDDTLGMMATQSMMTAMHSMACQDCEKNTGKGKTGKGPGQCWGRRRFEEVGGKDTVQPARRCARSGCPFAANKCHPRGYCCNDCHEYGCHGPRCRQQVFDAVPAAPDCGVLQQQHQRRCARSGCPFVAAEWHPKGYCCNDCDAKGCHGPRCRQHVFGTVAAVPDCEVPPQHQRRCARSGCPFAAAEWHPKGYCCDACQKFGGHGRRCQKQAVHAVATQDCGEQQRRQTQQQQQQQQQQFDLSLPVVVDGGNFVLTWTHGGDDIQQVAEAFAQAHSVHPDEVPNVVAAMQQHAVTFMGSRGEATPESMACCAPAEVGDNESGLEATPESMACCAPAEVEDNESGLEAQSRKLEEMGLGRADVLFALLKESGGSVRRVLEVLLSDAA